MTRYTLHVPEQYNDGAFVGAEVFDEVEDRVIRAAGGFTLTHGIGAWRNDDGTIYREPMSLYAIDSDDPETGTKLHELARKLADALRQEAIYLTTAQLGTELVTRVTA